MADAYQGFLEQTPGFATVAVRTGQEPEKWKSGAVVPPITTATTYKKPSPDEHNGYYYARAGNPSRNTLEECLTALEGGTHTFTFGSGMAAASTIAGLLSSGDHLVSSGDIYGGTSSQFKDSTVRNGVEVTFINFSNIQSVKAAIKDNTKMFWLETPTNPLLKVIDIAAIVAVARSHGNILVVVDNTFLTPYLQRPLDFGVDIVMYSMSKYMNGHSDVVMGAAVVKDKQLAQRLKFLQKSLGAVPSPFDCYLVYRSLKTLALRMERHKKTSLLLATYLENHPKVTKVMHPGLLSHPQHEIAKKQSSGHSGVFSFDHCGDLENSRKFLKSLKVFTLADSLGGLESLAGAPCATTHRFLSPAERAALGVTDTLVRLSVGLEDAEDLLEDLRQALDAAF